MILPSDYSIEKYGLKARFVIEDDAAFIVKLRTDKSLSKYIHSTDSSVENQKEWIQKYKEREALGLEYYFIFYYDENPIGLERIYNLTSDTFTHGSLVFSPDSPIGSSVKADIITREVGFSILNKKANLFDVSKGNNGVIAYHQRYKPMVISEDEEGYHYSLSKENFEKYKSVYMKIFKMQ